MWPIFKKQDNVSWFFYPAMIFLPMLALGVGAALYQTGQGLARILQTDTLAARLGPGLLALILWGGATATGAWGHFNTLIDGFTQSSVPDAEAAMTFVNNHTTADDFVLVPKQIYWLVKQARRSMLSHCGPYIGHPNGAWPVAIPRTAYWFDCRWQNAKYVVIASGADRQGRAFGIDLNYTRGAAGGQEVVAGMIAEHWPVVFPQPAQVVYPPQLFGQWPVLLDGEYLVLANPRLIKDMK